MRTAEAAGPVARNQAAAVRPPFPVLTAEAGPPQPVHCWSCLYPVRQSPRLAHTDPSRSAPAAAVFQSPSCWLFSVVDFFVGLFLRRVSIFSNPFIPSADLLTPVCETVCPGCPGSPTRTAAWSVPSPSGDLKTSACGLQRTERAEPESASRLPVLHPLTSGRLATH